MNSLARSLFASLALASAAMPALAQANVLILIGDDLGWDAVGCYGLGLRTVPTPNIDALAANGVRFTRAYMNPACSPTRGCLMTGRYGFRNGVPTTVNANDVGLNTNEVILPRALQNSGYATGMVGKWHLGHPFSNATPNTFGWPFFAGVIDSGVVDYYSWPRVVNGQVATETTYITTKQVNDALGWINAQTAPWMLMVSFCSPHAPYHTPPANLHTRNLVGADPAVSTRPFYEAMVESLDTEIGRLLSSMSPAVRANTNILLFGDNGTDPAQALAPFSNVKVKGSLYEPGSRIPFIVSGPVVASPGRTSSALVSAVDVFATVTDLCGAPVPNLPPSPAGPIDGVSIRPLLANTAASVRDHVYIDMSVGNWGGGYAVVDATHALIRKLIIGPQVQEFYRVGTDPLENNDLLTGTLTGPDLAAYNRLFGILTSLRNDGWATNVGTGCGSAAVPAPTLRSQTMPKIGRLYVTQVLGLRPQATSVYLSLGFTSHTTSSLGSLPLPLAIYGMPTCTAYTFDEILWQQFANPQATGGFLYLQMPYVPMLIGLDFTIQAFVAEPTANAAGLITTNAQRCVLGV